MMGHFLRLFIASVHDGIGFGEDNDIDDNNKFGDHGMRRSCCQHRYKAALAEDVIGRIARWRSDAIEAYQRGLPVSDFGPEALAPNTRQIGVELAVAVHVDKMLQIIGKRC